MKKVLAVLLTLVMAICLINLNNSHTKAEDENPEVTYKVIFNMQGHGTQIDSQWVEEGSLATKPTDPTAKGYTFFGWYTDPGCTSAYDFATPVTAETILYAKWTSNPFTITAMEDGTNIILNKNGSYTPPALQYSVDGGDATDYQYDHTISVNKGQKVSFITTASSVTPLSQSSENYVKVVVNKKIEASGNIMSLVDKDNFSTNKTITGDYCFCNLFHKCANLISIDGLQLPATTLTAGCYRNMFFYCKNLTSIPEGLLPATTLKSNCYESMFQGCAALSSIPEKLLPATTLNTTCYAYMFYGCTGLSSIPEKLLPATTLAATCYCSMFEDCTNLINIPNLPAPGTLPDECYANMFKGCSSLDLKAATTPDDTYAIPFRIPTTGSATSGTDSLKEMFNGTKAATTGGTPSTDTQYYIAKDITAPKVTATCASNGSVNVNVVKDSGSQIDAILTGYNGTLSTIKLDGTKDLILGSEYTLLDHSSTANASEKELILSKLLISSLSEGTHTVVLTTDHTPAITYTLNITIQPKPSPSPSPSKKDESCEKVIGPTWHWNNSKGICEDYGVVGTATR